MLQETRDAPRAVERLLAGSSEAIDALAQRLRQSSIRTVATVARGSSDHAANFMGYLLMVRLGVIATSLPPSVVTLHNAPINTEHLAAIAFSQSGRSPDLIATISGLRQRGAMTAAFVNDIASPLAQLAEHAIDLRAGAERSVAATKSFITQVVAGVYLLAAWAQDQPLLEALAQLPRALDHAVRTDWSFAVDELRGADRLLVIGRGAGLSIANEMALKFKETCGIQAEAFSGAEVKHGTMALMEPGYPVLVIAPRGPTQGGLIEVADELRGRGAHVMLAASHEVPQAQLRIVDTGHEHLDGISAIQSFYPMVEALALARGLDPDKPKHLSKVTRTQ